MKVCSIEGCGGTFKVQRGLCNKHYIRLLRNGSPTAGGTYKGQARAFFEKALTYEGDDCLIWPFFRDKAGYARLREGSESRHVHRLVCRRVHGEPDDINIHATHECGNGHLGCVNPKHLKWGTRYKNQKDRVYHGTSNRGEQCAAHKLTAEEAIVIYHRLLSGERAYLLAKEYGVSDVTILDIGTGRSWAWLTGLKNPKERDVYGNLVNAPIGDNT